jgi:hypothetical protein
VKHNVTCILFLSSVFDIGGHSGLFSQSVLFFCLCRHLIIENFIPMEEKNKIVSRAFFDEEDDHWKVKAITRLEE